MILLSRSTVASSNMDSACKLLTLDHMSQMKIRQLPLHMLYLPFLFLVSALPAPHLLQGHRHYNYAGDA
jgi:hypothetical protein